MSEVTSLAAALPRELGTWDNGRPGPTLLVLGGVHGNEPAGVVALQRVLGRLRETDLPISGEITEKGKSDNTRDTVKIVGGTAAGAIIGDQVIKGDKGKVIGGLLGGAIGAVAAQKTGTDVQMAEGTALSLILNAPVEITK